MGIISLKTNRENQYAKNWGQREKAAVHALPNNAVPLPAFSAGGDYSFFIFNA